VVVGRSAHFCAGVQSSVDDQALLVPAFGFRLELGTPMTPEQRAEVLLFLIIVTIIIPIIKVFIFY
jgi:hypothetical protein